MPKPALRTCRYPGCPELVPSGFCVHHQQATRARQHQQYHDAAVQALYKSARWQRIRARQLATEPWCAACLRANTYTPATDVDHIAPHHGDKRKFYAGPFQSLCHACHSRKTAYEVGFAQGEGGIKSSGAGGSGAAGASENPLYGFGVLNQEAR